MQLNYNLYKQIFWVPG